MSPLPLNEFPERLKPSGLGEPEEIRARLIQKEILAKMDTSSPQGRHSPPPEPHRKISQAKSAHIATAAKSATVGHVSSCVFEVAQANLAHGSQPTTSSQGERLSHAMIDTNIVEMTHVGQAVRARKRVYMDCL